MKRMEGVGRPEASALSAGDCLPRSLADFESEEDWLGYRLEHDARFPQRIAAARESLRTGSGVRLEEIEVEEADEG